MVRCEHAFEEDLAARYVTGDLPEPEQDAFEVHLLECEDCARVVSTLGELPDVLPASMKPLSASPRSWSRTWRVRDVLALAAGLGFVAVAAGVLIQRMPAPGPARSESLPSSARPTEPTSMTAPAPPQAARGPEDDPKALAALARIEPPRYLASRARGASSEPEGFAEAMADYERRDFIRAATALRKVVARAPEDVRTRFFLGISELMCERPLEAVTELQLAAASGREGYAEAASFYLAKALLASGRTDRARAELSRLAAGGGDYSAPAKKLLSALVALAPERP